MPAAVGTGPGSGLSPYQCTAAQLVAVTQLTGGNAEIATQICATVDVGLVGATNAVLTYTVTALAQAQDVQQQLETGLNTAFLLTSGYQVRLALHGEQFDGHVEAERREPLLSRTPAQAPWGMGGSSRACAPRPCARRSS